MGAACSVRMNAITSPTTAGGSSGNSAPPALVDRTLLARYYIDEAAAGQAPTLLNDSASSPLALPLTYSGADPVFTAPATGRGLSWSGVGLDGRACIDVSGTKIYTGLHGGTTVTYEVVADIAAMSSSGSRLLHIGEGLSWQLTLGAVDCSGSGLGNEVFFSFNHNDSPYWSLDLATQGRTVLTVVVDTREAVPSDRIKLYQDGVLVPQVGNIDISPTCSTVAPVEVAQNETLNLSTPSTYFCVGNREIQDRSPQGSIYYAAVYEEPLTPTEVLNNATLLLADDDI